MSPSSPAAYRRITSSFAFTRRAVLAVVAAISVAAVALPATALGAQTRPEVSVFDGSGSDAGVFAGLGRIAIHQSSGTVYAIADPGVVDKFDASGTAQDFSALASSSLDGNAVTAPDGPVTFSLGSESDLAVDNSGGATDGRVYVLQEYGANPHTAFVFAADGSYLHKIDVAGADTCGIAVDSGGDVWIADYNSKSVKEYDAAGAATGAAVDTSGQGSPCHIAFDSADNLYVALYGGALHKYDAGGVYVGQIDADVASAVAVDPATNHVFAAHSSRISEYDSAGALVVEFGQSTLSTSVGVAVSGSTDRVYASAGGDQRIHGFGAFVLLADVATGSATTVTASTATLGGSVNPDGVAVTDCHFEYTTQGDFEANGFADATDAPCVPDPGSGSTAVDVSADITGLAEETAYRFRLVATNANGANPGADQGFQTPPAPGAPLVETTGSPVRTSTSARLDARVRPSNAPADYHFEYGPAPCDANPCTSTASHPAGSGNFFVLVSQQVTDLQPNTTYHYRVVADNGEPAGPSVGEDRTVTTRASDAPLSHGSFPGPSGSDRAWEQVNSPDTSGNPVDDGRSFSDNGDRAVYNIAGGSSETQAGSRYTQALTERFEPSPHQGGWRLQSGFPARSLLAGANYLGPVGPTDLSSMLVVNIDGPTSAQNFFRVVPGSPATPVVVPPGSAVGAWYGGSESSNRVVALLKGGVPDPDHPGAGALGNLYDISSGSPKLVSQLPGDALASCDVTDDESNRNGLGNQANGRFGSINWISPNGNFVFFPTGCYRNDLYVRDIAAADTRLVSKDPLSGPACSASMLQSNNKAVFFWTQSRLAAEDTDPAACDDGSDPADGDVYRYDLAGDALKCVTCVVSGRDADVAVDGTGRQGGSIGRVAVARDGSRVYFTSPNRLLPGAAANGTYRVDVASGDLAYVAAGARVGDYLQDGNAISRDGSVVVFRSADPRLDAVGGQQNGGTAQFYRYDDRDRSLVCVSCPADGSLSRADVNDTFISNTGAYTNGNNLTPIDGDGDVYFTSSTSLVPADQNTAAPGQDRHVGDDVYEWRDGRLLLITDGVTDWTNSTPPVLQGVTPSGRDVFFLASAQLTPDALDGFSRLYDARVGGGFAFADALSQEPCPLESCQGDPSPAPGDSGSGSSTFDGVGNLQSPAAARVSVSKPGTAIGYTTRLRVKVSGKGRLVTSGPGLKSTKRSVGKASTVTIRVSLSAAGRRQLAKHNKLTRKLKVAFSAAGGRGASATVSLTFKAPQKRGR